MSKYKKLLSLIAFTLILTLSACNSTDNTEDSNNKKPTKVDYMQKEVIRIHDEVMPRMQEIAELQKEMKNKTDSLKKLENAPSDIIESIEMKKLGLDATAASMMKWMKDYREPKEKSEEEAMAYLENEKKKIEEIAIEFDEQITKCKNYLSKFE